MAVPPFEWGYKEESGGWQAREDHHGVGAYRWRRTAAPSQFSNFGIASSPGRSCARQISNISGEFI
jgi:hypothetical protein